MADLERIQRKKSMNQCREIFIVVVDGPTVFYLTMMLSKTIRAIIRRDSDDEVHCAAVLGAFTVATTLLLCLTLQDGVTICTGFVPALACVMMIAATDVLVRELYNKFRKLYSTFARK